MLDPQSVVSAAEVLGRAKKVLAVTHVQPDGDAAGSLLAMGVILKQLGISFDLLCDDGLPKRYGFLPFYDQVKTNPSRNKGYDLLIALDIADMKRMGRVYSDLVSPKPPIVNIDHHITNTNFGQINLVDGQASATAQVLFSLLADFGAVVTQNLAQCLLTGLVADTLNFSISGVTSDTLRTAAALMDAGANLFEISNQALKLQHYSTLQLWQIALRNIKLDDGLLWTTINNSESQAVGHIGSSSFGLGNFLANVYEVLMSAVLIELEDGRVSVSFRCRPPFDVSVIAASLGGGGHRLAAGCLLNGPLAEAESRVISTSKEALNKQREQQRVSS